MEYSFKMAKPPSTALVMHPVVCDELIRDDHMQRLRNVTNLIAEEPFREVTDLAESMQQVEVLVTSWGLVLNNGIFSNAYWIQNTNGLLKLWVWSVQILEMEIHVLMNI